ncbi:MAG: hypothetical protein JNL43_15730 [Flavobacteriales bacterium]|nr:hypothetical protein [Flavobacteriales bacterium]
MDRSSSVAKAYRGILLLVIALVPLSYLGFRASYWDFFPRFGGVGWPVHFHLLTIAAWMTMLVAQAWLAAKGHIARHKRIGRLSYLLVPLIVIGFVVVADYGQLRHKEPGLLGASFFDGGAFLAFYAFAIAYRRNTPYHSRYMMLTAVPFINPTLGRAVAPEVSTVVELVLIIGLLVAARVRKTAWQPYLVALITLIALTLAIVYISVIEPGIIEGLWDAIWG